MRNRITLTTLIVLGFLVCGVNTRVSLDPNRMAELWQEPKDLERRDLLHGPGGARNAPHAGGRYHLVEADDSGFSPGYDVKDEQGREWSVKLGPESRTEVVVSRIVWAMGYHQPVVYYLPNWTLIDNGKARREGPARFRLETSRERNRGNWSWRYNPFLDTQPFTGLFVLMAIVNNWDLKSQQNVIYRVETEGEHPASRYVVRDLGASLGKTSWWLPGTRDDAEGFEREPFIKGVSGNRVMFHFQGAWREPQLLSSVTPDDVQWMCERLARLTPRQWLDAFRAGGYTDAEAMRFIRRLRAKVDEGAAVTSRAPSRPQMSRSGASPSSGGGR